MTLIEAVAHVESGADPYAMRFEPALYGRCSPTAWQCSQREAIQRANHCDTATADMIACTSWGAYQLLGVNIYANGYADAISDYANAPQEAEMRAFVQSWGAGFESLLDTEVDAIPSDQLLAFARRYNGPGDPQAYASALTSA